MLDDNNDGPSDGVKASQVQPLVYLRINRNFNLDQDEELKKDYNNSNYKIYAPSWVKECLKKLSNELFSKREEISFDIEFDLPNKEKEKYTIRNPLTLRDLQILARNEAYNTNGVIPFDKYQIDDKNHSPLGFTKEIVRNLKDLVRHCIILGQTKANMYGGYGGGERRELPNKPDVLICDLSGLQFQTHDNSGRLVLIAQEEERPLLKGVLDDEIYQHIVGEPRPTIAKVKEDQTGRFVEATFVKFVDFEKDDQVISGLKFTTGRRTNQHVICAQHIGSACRWLSLRLGPAT